MAPRGAQPRRVLLSLVVCLAVALALSPALAFAPSDVTSYRGLVWRFLDQWPSSTRPRQHSTDLDSSVSHDAAVPQPSPSSLFALGNETWETRREEADSKESTESTGTSKAEGVPVPGRAAVVAGASASRKWLGHVARQGVPMGKRRQMADAWLDGPCSDYETAVVINITSAADFSKRLQFDSVTTVILELQKNLVISKGILFNSNFSCTIFRSAKTAAVPFQITHTGANEPVLRIWNTSNVLVLKVDFKLSVRTSSPACTTVPEVTSKAQCPTISIIGSYGIQLAKGSVFGRIDLHRTMSSRVDSMRVTGIPIFNQSPGVIQVTYSGHGPTLGKSFIAITNNEVYGVHTPIVLHRGTIGAIVRNNYVHDYIFAGIRCGSDVHFQADCMLTQIDRNHVVAAGKNRSGDQDAAGIYYCVHWFSPDNTAECNYIYNGDHCYYLDFVTSGVTIKGGACINTYDGIKVNNGKWNYVEGVIIKKVPGSPGWSTCFTPTVLNCNKNPGTYWELMRKQYYDTPLFQAKYPFWPDVCNQKTIDNKPCNTNKKGTFSADQTGACSGLPTENFLNLVLVETEGRDVDYKYCEKLPTVEAGPLNDQRQVNLTNIAAAKFMDYANDDLGVNAGSSLFSSIKDFKSCPRKDVGPRRIDDAFYYLNFNRPEPDLYKVVLSMSTKHVHDPQVVKLSKVPKKKGK
ncbi:hypothetical protein CLOM_g3961 [Closterium sp. NIES-68]|nr:hypothetical protein CLOM_g3961 [Closterium sp. NIES-68]GJP85900.1 hypothetical protein CLOP_g15994 [Closterium sp. NIES-67]